MIFSMPTWINTEKCTHITVCQANLTQPPHQDYNTESWQSSQYWLYKARNSSATELENVKNKGRDFLPRNQISQKKQVITIRSPTITNKENDVLITEMETKDSSFKPKWYADTTAIFPKKFNSNLGNLGTEL